MEPTPGEQTALRAAAEALWRRSWILAATFVAIPVAVFVASSLLPKTYEARALVSVLPTAADPAELPETPTAAAQTAVLLVGSPQLAKRAAGELDGAEAGTLGGSVRAEPLVPGSEASLVLVLTGVAEDPDRAAELANAYAKALGALRTEAAADELAAAIADTRGDLASASDETVRAELARRLDELRDARTSQRRATQLIEEATAPTDPVSPRPARNTALAGVVWLLLGLGLVAVAERLDRRLRGPAELEELLGVPWLAASPAAAFNPEHSAAAPVSEAFRTLAASLRHVGADRSLGVVVIAGPTQGDGKTTVATGLAVAIAGGGHDVVLVDCDLRRPQAAARLGIERRAGLAELLAGRVELDEALTPVETEGGRLEVLPAGQPPAEPARLLGSSRMRRLLEELSGRADVVILDTAPLLGASDAVPLVAHASGVIAVARVRQTTHDALTKFRQVVEAAGGSLLGGVATDA